MKKSVYVRFDIEADSYQEAEQKLDAGFKSLDCVISDDQEIRNVLSTRKIVNKVHI